MKNLTFAKSVRTINSLVLALVAVTFFVPAVVDKALEVVGYDNLLMADALAQGSKKEKRKLPGMSESMFKKLGKVTEAASPEEGSGKEPDFALAIKELKKIEKGCEKCNAYEVAQVYNYFGWVYYSMEDYPNSIKYYNLVVKQSPNIPWGMELQSIYTLAQLEYTQERYAKAIAHLDKWMELSDTVGADVYNLKSSICYQMEDKNCAIKNINIAINMVEEKGKIAKEAWYSLKRSLYLEKEDYKSALPILVKLVRHYPKKAYHQQLASVYGMLEQEKMQLAALDGLYLMGGIEKEQKLLNLAYLLIQGEYPYRAAKILEKGFADKMLKRNERNLETLAKAWGQAQEKRKAIPIMEEAAKLSDNGDLFGTLMGLYLDIDDSKKAIKAGKDALKKGKLKRVGDINLNIGVALLDIGNFGDAISYFKEAKKDKRTKRFAETWLKYAEREEYRRKQLES
ncbi:tetratricopeptide repeat protein [Teredinibacter haidensis]|uniref:tetratricopeptide repeat protein n=1 Tax=Teredinibacter haidensis TaxID=2731755 RepID=UPI000948D8AD|nr:hypothetical protein [Teredinibacter haidensis]